MVRLATLLVRKSMSLAQSLVEPYAEGAMNSLVRITRNGGWDPDLAEYNPDGETVIYADSDDDTIGAMAGVTSSSGPISMDVGDEVEFYDSITVMIPRSHPAEPRINDLVRIMAGPDTDLIGRYFRITGVPVGGRLLPSNTFTATGIAKSRTWSSP